MGKNGFEKATAKMFENFGSSVKIAHSGGGERMSKAEREKLRGEVEAAQAKVESEQREQERNQVIKDLADILVKDREKQGSAVGVEKAPTAGRGRPAKNPEIKDYVLMNFRVGVDFRQRLKVIAAERGTSVMDLFEEAFGLLFEKYNLK